MHIFSHTFSRVLFLCVMALSTLSANQILPNDPAFLQTFTAPQQKAIQLYLAGQLGKDASLKELHAEYFDKLAKLVHKRSSKKRKYQKIDSCEHASQNRHSCHKCLKKIYGKLKEIESRLECSNAIAITEEDIGTEGYIIQKPGHYCLAVKDGYFVWNPSRSATLITIDADNVILDLNNASVVQSPISPYPADAIAILSGHENITIRNGSFVGFTADAIACIQTNTLLIENLLISENMNKDVFAPLATFGSISILACFNVVLKDVRVVDTSVTSNHSILTAGILIGDTQTFLLKNCKAAHLELSTSDITSQCLGISMLLSKNGLLENCEVSNCVSNGIMPAFGYVGSANIVSRNCIANYNTGTQTTSGYYPQLSDSLQFINCDACNNHSTCQDCHGFAYFISNNGYIANCRAFNNVATNPSGGFNEKCTGFEILVCNNCIVENCEAYNNSSTKPIRHYAAGFANGNSINVTFRNCTSIGNTAIGNQARGVGFGPALDPRFFGPCTGTVWDRCLAEGNFGDTQSIGFDLFGQIGGILMQSTSQNNGLGLGNGIGIASNSSPYDEGNPVDVSCNEVPIVVMTNNAEKNVLVKDNTIAGNSFVGILDTTTANNVYIANTVYNNPTNFVGTIFTTGTPIRNWTAGSPPSNANNNGISGDNLDNFNITPP